MEKFIIQGGKKLSGDIDVRGAKNAAFPLIAAAILTKEDVVIHNLPLIEDVFRMLEIMQSMEATVDWLAERTVKINTRHLDPSKIDSLKVKRLRGSVVLLGPLLARFGNVFLARPGGDMIGVRPIDTHLDAFIQLGAKVTQKKDGVQIDLEQKIAGKKEVILNEFSVTATENILLFAAGTSAQITVKTADFDYQIQELVKVLQKMGAEITLSGLHALTIKGSIRLKGAVHTLMYDPTEAGTFVLMGAIAPGEITVKNVEVSFLDLFFKKLKDFGVTFEIARHKNGLVDIKVSHARNLKIDKIQCFIYPGIHSDLQSPLGVLATQSKGPTLLHDPLYAGRLKYLEELNKMGAEIFLTDPHRAIINGPAKLYGAEVNASDLRGGAALIAAAFIARGESILTNVYQVDRGYEKIEERLQKLGADIKRVVDN
ncbi:MAG: UDP-N-acetylglucosamine 1-carboxyvinyltransferase [Candidatus Wildermuthbacteria bacterium]|nr:UDP-N-acetylglucosamine 1-carboxyvinyltransferase [Candidatus Wildermuthbacteria bacterium]